MLFRIYHSMHPQDSSTGEVSKCRQQNVEKKMSTRKRRQIKISTEQNVDTKNVESSNTAKSPSFTLTCTPSPSKEALMSFNHGNNLETLQFLIFSLSTFSLSTICAVDVFLSTKDFRHFATFPFKYSIIVFIDKYGNN